MQCARDNSSREIHPVKCLRRTNQLAIGYKDPRTAEINDVTFCCAEDLRGIRARPTMEASGL